VAARPAARAVVSAVVASAVLGGAGGAGGGTTDASQISTWVAAHFTAKTVGGMTVYDLTTPAKGRARPGAGRPIGPRPGRLPGDRDRSDQLLAGDG
jgi:hypothetical protein